MQFSYPYFLWALASLVIPIIVHLFNFRRFRTVYFSNISFLKNIEVKTHKQKQLKKYLILATRCLALIFLVLAFSEPIIPGSKKNAVSGSQAISIYIDNSFSMSATGKEGTLLDEAKQKARETVKSFSDNNRFQLLNNDFEGRHQRLVSKDEMLKLIEEVKISSSSKDIADVCRRQEEALGKAEGYNKSAIIISDFQKSIATKNFQTTDTAVSHRFVPLKANSENNLSVDSCWLEVPHLMPNVSNKLFVRIKNYGIENIENGSVNFTIDGTQKAVAGFNVSSENFTIAELNFVLNEKGNHSGTLSIIDNPITFDDKLYISLAVEENIKILMLNGNGENSFLNKLFSTDGYFQIKNMNFLQPDFSQFKETNFIILNEATEITAGMGSELQSFINKGGSLFIIPSENGKNISSLNKFISQFGITFSENAVSQKQKITAVNFSSEIFRDAFEKLNKNISFPEVEKYFKLNIANSASFEKLFSLNNGDVIAGKINSGKGKIFLLSTSLSGNSSDIPYHSLFVPLMLKPAMLSVKPTQLFHYISDKTIDINSTISSTENIKLKGVKTELIPSIIQLENSIKLYLGEGMKEPGHYTLVVDGKNISGLSFNESRKESEQKFLNNSEIEKQYGNTLLEPNGKPLKEALAESLAGKQLWKICMCFSLYFLLAEIFIIKFFKQKAA